MCEEEIVRRQGKKKLLPIKLQLDLQESKNKKMKKQKRPKSKGSRNTNSVKAVRWDSMERLRPNFFIKYHSDESERSRIKHQDLKLQNVTGVRSPSRTTSFSFYKFCVSSMAVHLELR